jgi:hypothetical protein
MVTQISLFGCPNAELAELVARLDFMSRSPFSRFMAASEKLNRSNFNLSAHLCTPLAYLQGANIRKHFEIENLPSFSKTLVWPASCSFYLGTGSS